MKKILLAIFLLLLIGSACTAEPGEPTQEEESQETAPVPSFEDSMEKLTLSSSAFTHEGNIPSRYTCDGEDINPPLAISNIPEGTQSLALIVDDPDAPVGDWVHWLMWNISPKTEKIGENSVPENAVEGMTDFGRVGWGGPCPPSGVHRYQFKLYALDTILNLPQSTKKRDLEKAMQGHILDEAKLIGLYKRQ